MNRFIILFSFIIFGAMNLFAKNSAEIIDSISNSLASDLSAKLQAQNVKSVSLCFLDKNAELIFKSNFATKLSENRSLFDCSKSDNIYKIETSAANFSINFESAENSDDSLKRTIMLKARIALIDTNKLFLTPIDFSYSKTEIVSQKDLDELKKTKYAAMATEKERQKTFWEEYFEPVAIVGSAALIVVTLFSARSK